MRDTDVRTAVRKLLHGRYANTRTRIIEEMGVWSGTVRIDVAVINGELQGYELKSAKDDLRRLEYQVEVYSQVFDRLTLVTAACHLDRASEIVPSWWGIMVAEGDETNGVVVQPGRPTQRNPSIQPLTLARLLWRQEALSILERQHLDRGIRSARVDVLAAKLAELPLGKLKREVREALKTRVDWLGKPVSDQRQVAV